MPFPCLVYFFPRLIRRDLVSSNTNTNRNDLNQSCITYSTVTLWMYRTENWRRRRKKCYKTEHTLDGLTNACVCMCITVGNGRLKQVLNSGKCPKIFIYFIIHSNSCIPSHFVDESFYRFHWMRENHLPSDNEIYRDALLIHAPFSKRDTMRNHYRLWFLFLMVFSNATL